MNDNSKVVLLTSNLFKPHFGGVENSLYHLALAYKSLGYKPLIVVSDIAPDGSALPSRDVFEGICVLRYSMSKPVFYMGIKLPKLISGIVNSIRLYREVIKSHSPSIIITRYHFNQLFCKLAGGSNTVYLVPGVVRFQNSSKNVSSYSMKEYCKWYYHLLLQYCAFKSTDQLAVFSHNMEEQIKTVFTPNNDVILTKPGVDTERFFPLSPVDKLTKREKNNLNCNGSVFLCVGRCVAAKGFDIAIDAFSQLKGTEHQLWIVGDGDLLDEYKEKVRMSGLANVKFLGATSEPEKFYRIADYFLMTSTYEPLGQTILEALSSGLPVLAFEPSSVVNTASREILDDKCSVFISNPHPDELSKTIINVAMKEVEEYKEFSINARTKATSEFSWPSLANDLLKAFDNVS